MEDFSILIGGKAGEGIDNSSSLIASILNKLGYYIYVYRDYPSIIRGGHTFSIIRASVNKVNAHSNKIDFLLALNQDALDFHKDKLTDSAITVFDSSKIKSDGIAIDCLKIIKEEKAIELMKNTIIIAAFFKIIGINFEIIENVLKEKELKELELNLLVAKRGYAEVQKMLDLKTISSIQRPIVSGNDAVALGLINAGLDAYLSYPMTPTSNILHFMAQLAEKFGLKVIHPESELAVILMALGFASMGCKAAIGTSGGGFCLMTEGLSFSAIAELPIVIVMGQRPGPATGLPTYTGQSELNFVLNAGHGDFLRFVVAPGDSEEAFYFSSLAMNLAWKYQIPSIILTDKLLSEGYHSFDTKCISEIKEEKVPLSDEKNNYKRYLDTKNGISPLSFPPMKDNVIKINSYEHDESGITIEDAKITKDMQEKRFKKQKYLEDELENYPTIATYGNNKSKTALICFGSNKGVCIEIAKKLDLFVIQIAIFSPFPIKKLKEAVKDLEKIICVENNFNGQMANIIRSYGVIPHFKILKYDGRPFTTEGLEDELKKVMK
jgi:2-oxoglutarate ferredoxin oxidoreductase subunit alpha